MADIQGADFTASNASLKRQPENHMVRRLRSFDDALYIRNAETRLLGSVPIGQNQTIARIVNYVLPSSRRIPHHAEGRNAITNRFRATLALPRSDHGLQLFCGEVFHRNISQNGHKRLDVASSGTLGTRLVLW